MTLVIMSFLVFLFVCFVQSKHDKQSNMVQVLRCGLLSWLGSLSWGEFILCWENLFMLSIVCGMWWELQSFSQNLSKYHFCYNTFLIKKLSVAVYLLPPGLAQAPVPFTNPEKMSFHFFISHHETLLAGVPLCLSFKTRISSPSSSWQLSLP